VDAKIAFARLKLAGWVIMRKNDGGGSVSDNVGKDFAGMNRVLPPAEY